MTTDFRVLPTTKRLPWYKPYLSSIMLLLLGLLIFIGVDFPVYSSLQDLQRKLTERRAVMNTLAAKSSALASIDQATQDKQVAIALHAVPIIVPFQQSLPLVERLFTKFQLGVKELTFQDNGDSVGVSFSATGLTAQFIDFLKGLAHALPLSTMSDLTLLRLGTVDQGASGSSGVYTAQFQVRVPYKQAPESIGKPSDPLPVLSAHDQQVLETLRTFESTDQSPTPTVGAEDHASSLFAQ